MQSPLNPKEKPDSAICPRQFCFCWQMGRMVTARTPDPDRVTEGCGNPFGICTRLDPKRGDADWYEPHEPNLQKAGLPWFYFIASPDGLVAEFKARYLVESEALWGGERRTEV